MILLIGKYKNITNNMNPFNINNFLPIVLMLAILGCSGKVSKIESPKTSNSQATPIITSTEERVSYKETGKASFYADKFQSRKTASDERFDQSALTAAHRKLPFNTKVKVTNIANGKSVVVRINDRGPFVSGRVIDLSSSAFKKIGDTRLGVIDVKIEALK